MIDDHAAEIEHIANVAALVDGQPIGCAARKEQAITLLDRQPGSAEIGLAEKPLAFHLTSRQELRRQ